MRRRWWLVAVLLFPAIAACYRPLTPAHRLLDMGMTFWPPWRDAAEAERLAPLGVGLTLAHSDMLQVQIPWHPGSDAVQQAAWISGIAREHERPLVIALDWQDPSRRALAGGGDWCFSDTAVQAAFLRDAQELVQRYRPRYLILGVEVNYYARVRPDDFAAFVALFRRMLRPLKTASPYTEVLVTFQYEQLQGLDPLWPGGADDTPLRAFGGDLVLFGLSVYPHLAGVRDGELPDGYFAGARRLARGPWGIFETAWPTDSGEEAQAEYLRRLLLQTDNSGLRLLIWTATMDTAELPTTAADAAAFAAAGDWMRHLGLFTRDGRAKRAVAVWDAARTPAAR